MPVVSILVNFSWCYTWSLSAYYLLLLRHRAISAVITMSTTPCCWQTILSGLEMSGRAYSPQICKTNTNSKFYLNYGWTFRCFDHCSGYNYYGLIWGNQCACGNELPPDEYKQDETYCDVPCVGDSDVPCGGPDNTINIYEADGAAGTISTTESIIGSTWEPTVPTTEDVVTASPMTTSMV